jgi:hypothetical protein
MAINKGLIGVMEKMGPSRRWGGRTPAQGMLGIDGTDWALALQNGPGLGHGLQGLVLGGCGREPANVRRGNDLGMLGQVQARGLVRA